MQPSSVPVERRKRRAKSDKIDADLLLRTLLAWLRGEPRVCSMVAVPEEAEEDARRYSREREELIRERIMLSNRIGAILATLGIDDYNPLRRDRRVRLEALRTALDQPLPEHARAKIVRIIDRLELVLSQVSVLESQRDAVLEENGRPICTEMWPGATADVTTLLPVVDRLRQRFSIGRVCVVADRGMISAATIEGLEARKLEYILGARERSDAIVRKIVLENDAPFVPLLLERKAGETQLFVKQLMIEGKRYIVCRNEAEAEKDRKDREAIVAALDTQLKKGDKALIGNSAYRRYLRKSAGTKDKTKGKDKDKGDRAFEIDAGKLAEEARFDGIFVLRTNANVTPLQAVLRYRDLLQVENLFLRTKAIMRTRPIFHSSDAAIRGHVFCSFLALAMQKYLDDLSCEAGVAPEWKELLRDLDRLQQVRLRYRDADWMVRTDAARTITALFRQAHVALPPRARQTAPPNATAPTKSAPKRRGRPRRSATPSRISP